MKRVPNRNDDNFDLLIGPWGGIGDVDELWPRYDALNPNSEADMKRVIREDIVPEMRGFSDDRRARALDGLRYILSLPTEEIQLEWDGILPGFDLPDEPRRLFIWIKEVFEEYQIYLTNYDEP